MEWHRIVAALGCAWMAYGQGMATQGAAAAAREKPSGRPFAVRLTDVAAAVGLRARFVNGGETAKKYIVEANGNGVAFVDYDNDGWDDIFLVNGTQLGAGNMGGNYLFRNERGRFSDVTKAAGMERRGWGNGVCAGDVDGDGHDDLFVTYWGANVLYRNTGKGAFRAEAWADKGEWSTGCAFFDFDRDGKQDLAVARYAGFDLVKTPLPGAAANCRWKGAPVFCGPRGLPMGGLTIYRGKGDGTFTEVSSVGGFYGFTVAAGDWDGDGWMDIYVASDSTPSALLRNNGNGTFSEIGAETGLAFNEHGYEQGGMGVAAGDFDNDGRLDLIKTNFAGDYPNVYRNAGGGVFEDVVMKAGLAVNPQYVAWGVGLADFDSDGWLDVFQVNGHVFPGLAGEEYANPRLLYRNLGGGKFEDVSALAGPGVAARASSRGAAFADFDNDGDVDVLIMNMHGAPALLRNDSATGNNWVQVLVKETGTVVTVEAGGRKQAQTAMSQTSFLSYNGRRLHFGLGKATRVDALTVQWPSGRTERIAVDGINKLVKVGEGE
ncbi:MAG: CRTAC1 family protein [Bryobacterales bacterium]|nr:CRTAC1 family protein [Bryobacterales bacterium]